MSVTSYFCFLFTDICFNCCTYIYTYIFNFVCRLVYLRVLSLLFIHIILGIFVPFFLPFLLVFFVKVQLFLIFCLLERVLIYPSLLVYVLVSTMHQSVFLACINLKVQVYFPFTVYLYLCYCVSMCLLIFLSFLWVCVQIDKRLSLFVYVCLFVCRWFSLLVYLWMLLSLCVFLYECKSVNE